MKLKIIIEQEFDSDNFYADADPEDLEGLTFEDFSDTIVDFIWDNPDIILDDMVVKRVYGE